MRYLHLGGAPSARTARLRQHASELVRRVEAGEEIDMTVAGRLAAGLVLATTRRWTAWTHIASLFNGPSDPDSEHDRDLVDQSLDDPWSG